MDCFFMYSTSPDDPDAMLMPCPLIPWRRRDSRHWSGELWACYFGELDNGKHQSFGELEGSLAVTWLWINTYKPISTIFRVMHIHLPAILRFTRGTRFWPIPTCCDDLWCVWKKHQPNLVEAIPIQNPFQFLFGWNHWPFHFEAQGFRFWNSSTPRTMGKKTCVGWSGCEWHPQILVYLDYLVSSKFFPKTALFSMWELSQLGTLATVPGDFSATRGGRGGSRAMLPDLFGGLGLRRTWNLHDCHVYFYITLEIIYTNNHIYINDHIYTYNIYNIIYIYMIIYIYR